MRLDLQFASAVVLGGGESESQLGRFPGAQLGRRGQVTHSAALAELPPQEGVSMSDYGSCPVCGLTVNVPSGSSVPMHRAPGEQGKCPGSGQTAN